MAVYTPRGLKIRLSIPYVFALLERLYPKITPYKVLRMTEGIESIPGFLAFAVGLICLIFKVEFKYIILYVSSASVLGYFITISGFFCIPFLPELSTVYSSFTGFGIYYFIIGLVGFFVYGWQGVLAFCIGRTISAIVNSLYGIVEGNRMHKETGISITSAERNFYNAYRIYALKVGQTTNIELSEDELEEENWKGAFSDYGIEFPKVIEDYCFNKNE